MLIWLTFAKFPNESGVFGLSCQKWPRFHLILLGCKRRFLKWFSNTVVTKNVFIKKPKKKRGFDLEEA